jgi:hypothetical protein
MSRLLLVPLLVATTVVLPPAPPQGAALDRVQWLAGCWEQRRGDRVTVEMWTPARGGLALGHSRTIAGGALRSYEQLKLVAKEGGFDYVALPLGQRETVFGSTAVSDSGFTVENLAHDFPQRIIYRRVGADSLVARVEGPGQDGTRGFDIPMRRVPCGG